jgi:hypothetical protein
MTVRWACHLCLLLLIAIATGCGNSDLVEVTGRVTHYGEPVPNMLVTFLPADESRASKGVTNENGEFILKWSRDDVGAKRGSHTVILRQVACRPGRRNSKCKAGEDLKTIVAPYRDPQTSMLHFEVTHHGQFVEINLE